MRSCRKHSLTAGAVPKPLTTPDTVIRLSHDALEPEVPRRDSRHSTISKQSLRVLESLVSSEHRPARQ